MKWMFWVAAALVIYTYIGYAAWLWVRALFFYRPVQRGTYQPSVSIVMVVRNEEKVLSEKLTNLLELDYPADRCEVIVVSDGSTDGTERILREGSNPRVRIVLKQLSMGKACGLNDGIQMSQGELVMFTDARQKIESAALRLLAEDFADPDIGCVSGELMLGDPAKGECAEGLSLYWLIEKKVRELEGAAGSVVGATGAFYAVRRELLSSIPEGTILDDVYIPMEVVRQGRRVIFERRARAWDQPDLGADREFARKVRTLTGNYQLVQLAPWLLSGSNPVRFEFVSHKLLRLIVPFALAAILVASIVLQSPIYRVALLLQAILYGLSLVAWLNQSRGVLGRMTAPALTFVVLNLAAAVAFANFLTGRKAIWVR